MQLELTRLITAQTWGKPPSYPIYYTMCLSTRPTSNDILSRDSQMGVSKLPKLGLSWFWGPITLFADLWLRWGLRQSCSPCWELCNSMSHDTCTQRNRVDSQHLVVRSQIANLIPNHSFGHNLCFRCPNKSFDTILDIYISRDFQWYKELPNPMGFNPCNHFLKIQESIRTQMGAHLGVWMFILTLSHSRASLLAHAFASPCLGCEPKARVVTCSVIKHQRVTQCTLFESAKKTTNWGQRLNV
jgi:hypothetical protein